MLTPFSINTRALHYVLRLACAMCFIGHGAFGIITKPIWCNYFAVVGIGQTNAYRLMPLLGTADIIFGLILLVRPYRAVAAWLVVWGIFTALCRPLSGEPFAEFIERAGNFGTPLCLLLFGGAITLNARWLFSTLSSEDVVDSEALARVKMVLRFTVFLLLAGHGWLNLIQKPGLLSQYAALGVSNPAQVSLFAGAFEMLAAVAVLLKPVRLLVLGLLVWKMGTELFYPHYELFEWVERGGSYGSLLALWLCQPPLKKREETSPAGLAIPR